MSCVNLDKGRVFEYVDGQLANRTLALVESHIAACGACEHTAAGFRALIASASGELPAAANDRSDPWADITAARLKDPDWLLIGLADASALRQPQRVAPLIDEHFDRISSLEPEAPNAVLLLGYVALALELGLGHVGADVRFSYADLAASLLRRFRRAASPDMPLVECMFLELARGLVALHAERYPRAIRHLTLARRLAPQVGDRLVLAATCDALTRARSRQGKYALALQHVNRGLTVARQSGRQELRGVYYMRKGWILLQTEGIASKAAVELLKRAQATLQETDDYVNRGNATAALAKIPAHKGLYFDSVRHYERALDDYRLGDPRHPSLARALVNRAQLKLMIALRLRRPGLDATRTPDMKLLQREADVDLDEAREIYDRVRDVRGAGSVLLVRALGHISGAEYALAIDKARQAYDFGHGIRDRILMVRARIQECRAVHAMLSACSVNEAPAYLPLERARLISDEAVELTRHMQHRRLIAAAAIWKGLVLVHPYFRDVGQAAACCDVATANLDEHARDYIWDELQMLKQSLVSPPDQPTWPMPSIETRGVL